MLEMTVAEARKHFGPKLAGLSAGGSAKLVEELLGRKLQPYEKSILLLEPKPRMNKTETEYGRILESRKQRGEIIEYRFEGISLAWGLHPKTKKPMWYTPDFYVVMPDGAIELHEVKGGHIFAKDMIRFKGCRAEWPQFDFQMHQKEAGAWTQIQ